MLSQFKKFILRKKLFDPADRVLLAVSGGIDSVVMVHLFRKAGFCFGLAHCNFGLRGSASDADELFAGHIAGNAEVPFYSKHFNTRQYAAERGLSIQMAARELRYAFFEEIARKKGYDFIATAHHADDATETFFINLFRGTGISGLHGILPSKGNLIRPMLFARKEEICAYAKTHSIPFREDASNEEDTYLRNRIRHHLIPVLTEIDPAFSGTMQKNMLRIGQYEKLCSDLIRRQAERLIVHHGKQVRIPLKPLQELEPLSLFLHEFLAPYGFNEEVSLQLERALGGQPGKIFFSSSHRALIDRDCLILEAISAPPEPKSEYILLDENKNQVETPIPFSVKIFRRTRSFTIPDDQQTACLDAGKLTFPLRIRKWKRGDIFHPLGARGKKKLSDFFNDRKISRFDKENCWLLCSGPDIVWVIGYRISHKFRITAATNEVLIIAPPENEHKSNQ